MGDTIYEILKDENRNIIWINGNSTKECSNPQKCEEEAEDGNGLDVFWPSSPNSPAAYSKYIGGEKNGCMSTNSDDLWENRVCDNQNINTAVCVKRMCKRPE